MVVEFHGSLREKVFLQLEEDIISGMYKAGEKLTESMLSQKLQVSRTPVREAIRQLELEGLVESIPNKAIIVTGVTREDIEDIYGKDYKKQIKRIESIEDKYINAGKKVPWIIRLTGTPLYYLGKFRYRFVPGLIRFFNFQPEKWEKLQGTKRLITYPLIFIISILFIIYVVFVKFINAFAISLCSFGMIGFGTLPEKGLAKYLSIIEGVIGWFLLMFFTITLLSQVLQSAG